MNSDLKSPRGSLSIYVATAIPLAVTALIAARYGPQFGRVVVEYWYHWWGINGPGRELHGPLGQIYNVKSLVEILGWSMSGPKRQCHREACTRVSLKS